MKSFFYGLAVLVITAVAVWNINVIDLNINNLSGIILNTFEALSNPEQGTAASCQCTKRCDDTTVVSCTGYIYCKCNAGFNYVTCDDINAYC